VRDTQRLEEQDQELVSAYLAGDLDPIGRRRAEDLLAASEEARALAARLRAVDDVFATLPQPDPTARARVGARLEEAARRWRRGRRTLGVAGLCAAAAVLLAPVVRTHLPVRSTSARPGLVRTGPGEYRLLELGDRAVAFAGESAELEVREGSPRLMVRRGSVRLVVRPSRSEPFVVASPAAELAVLGTEFDVSVRDDVTDVRVTRGEVEVRNAHGRRRVWANETARVRADQSPRFIEPLRAIVIDGPAELDTPPLPRRRR
jgi:ferric-dicitrate binding protein FerR (iron transport regulator)